MYLLHALWSREKTWPANNQQVARGSIVFAQQTPPLVYICAGSRIPHSHIITMKRLIPVILLLSFILHSCTGTPSRKEIRNKILQEFICPGNATIEEMKIISTEEMTSYDGDK